MDDIKWNLKKRDSGQVYKDLTLPVIKTWILEARIEANDYVANAQMKKWTKASSVEVLKSLFSPEKSGSDVISSRDVTFGWNNDDEDENNIDLTPMIDVTFLLLIFFMVTATFAVHETMSITVPSGENTTKSKDNKLTISVDAQQNIRVNKQDVSLSQLKDLLRQKSSENQQQDVLLYADKKLQWEYVVKVLDQIKGSGIQDVKLKLEKIK